MGEDGVGRSLRSRLDGDERGGGGDIAVDQNGGARRRRADQRARHRRDLKPAESGQRVERGENAGAAFFRLFQYRQFARDPGLIQPGARADKRREGYIRDRADQKSGGRGVANPHLAQRDDRRAARHRRLRLRGAEGQRGFDLAQSQRILNFSVPRPAPDIGADQLRIVRQVADHAAIQNTDIRPGGPREDIRSRAARKEIQHHLSRHLRRPG